MSQRQNFMVWRFPLGARAAGVALFALLALAALPAALRAEDQYTALPAGAPVMDDYGRRAAEAKSGQTVRIVPAAPNSPAYLQLTPLSRNFACRAVFHWGDAKFAPNLAYKALPLCEMFADAQSAAALNWDDFKSKTPLTVYLAASGSSGLFFNAPLYVRCVRKGTITDTPLDADSMRKDGKGLSVEVEEDEKNITVFINEKPVMKIADEERALNFAWGTRAFYDKVAPVRLQAQIRSGSAAVSAPKTAISSIDSAPRRSGLEEATLLLSLFAATGVLLLFVFLLAERKKAAKTAAGKIANANEALWSRVEARLANVETGRLADASANYAALRNDLEAGLFALGEDIKKNEAGREDTFADTGQRSR